MLSRLPIVVVQTCAHTLPANAVITLRCTSRALHNLMVPSFYKSETWATFMRMFNRAAKMLNRNADGNYNDKGVPRALIAAVRRRYKRLPEYAQKRLNQKYFS